MMKLCSGDHLLDRPNFASRHPRFKPGLHVCQHSDRCPFDSNWQMWPDFGVLNRQDHTQTQIYWHSRCILSKQERLLGCLRQTSRPNLSKNHHKDWALWVYCRGLEKSCEFCLQKCLNQNQLWCNRVISMDSFGWIIHPCDSSNLYQVCQFDHIPE